MSCPYPDFDNRPDDTDDKVYIWREIKNNPHMYCWVPASKRLTNVLDLDLGDIIVQDVPPPPNFEEEIVDIAEKADILAEKMKIRKLEEGTDIVSADDASKYPIVKDFIVKKGLKLYGGAAINMYLPTEEKIYEDGVIPDYDMYSPTPWKDAVELANIMYNKGYKYTEVRSGIHKGTYKVFSNFWPVADITYMEKSMFNKLSVRKFKGLKVVAPVRLMEDMYKELSMPFHNSSRWSKVATRMQLIRKWANPIPKSLRCSTDIFTGDTKKYDPLLTQLLNKSGEYIDEKKLVHVGPLAYNTYLEIGGSNKRLAVDHYEVLGEDAHGLIREVFALLLPISNTLNISSVTDLQAQINMTRYTISTDINGKTVSVISIINLTSCTPYKFLLGRYVAAIDYIKYTLYTKAVFGETREKIKDAKCLIKYLTDIQNIYYKDKNVTELDDSPFQRFVINCKGPVQNDVKVEMLRRWKESTERKKRGKLPEEIPKECIGIDKKNCTYPCAWHDKKNLCAGIPSGIYRTG